MRRMSVLLFAFGSFSSPTQAAISTLAVSGDNATGIAGAKFDSFSLGSLNSSGQGVFLAHLQDAGGGISTANDQVVYVFTGGSLSPLAREGSGGVPDVAGANYASFVDMAMADTGDVLLRGALSQGVGGVSAANDQGLWRYSSGGNATVARTGADDAPGVAGEQFGSIPNVIRTTENGDVAFAGQLALGGTVTTLNNAGLWFYQGSMGTLLAREAISPVPGIPNTAFFALGKPSINDNSQAVAKATLKVDGNVTLENYNGVWHIRALRVSCLFGRGILPPRLPASLFALDNQQSITLGRLLLMPNLIRELMGFGITTAHRVF